MGADLSRRDLARIAAATTVVASAPSIAQPRDNDRYRPQIHYSPPLGFMNDPNGLVFDGRDYHLFHQLNPGANVAGNVHWGHAVSRDLLDWRTLPIALAPTAAGLVFSGSAVIDHDNTSGLFPGRPGGLVAAYTRHSDAKQVQEIAASADGGRSFALYAGNPVIDIGSTQFRDPKVFWHRPTRRWIMAVVRAREHLVVFYGSRDLKAWRELSRFGGAGVLGIDYECPDLVSLPIEGGGRKWVLFLSINPGAPQGGSTVQYFVGEFDGRRFRADDGAARFADFGKDYYALQSWSGVDDAPVAIAWMSNWQYTNAVPFSCARGAMTLPRRLSLRRRADDWRLVQAIEPLDRLADAVIADRAVADGTGTLFETAIPAGRALELDLRIRPVAGTRTIVRLSNRGGETLEAGWDAGNYPGFWIDRGGARGFANPYFTDKVSWAAAPGARETDVKLVLDRTSLELVGYGGEASGTMLAYPREPWTRLEIVAEGGRAALPALRLRTLRAIASASETAIPPA